METVKFKCSCCGVGWNDFSRPCFNCGAKLPHRESICGTVTTKEKINFLKISSGSRLKLETDKGLEDFTYHHLDGSCAVIKRNRDNKIAFLRFYTPLKKVGTHYEIV
ncbi:MAG: hypothetical protein HQ536_00575 [Parcubacteria group bacterium]|nr:hypothetical protein [Parcubacteria group bacterium]